MAQTNSDLLLASRSTFRPRSRDLDSRDGLRLREHLKSISSHLVGTSRLEHQESRLSDGKRLSKDDSWLDQLKQKSTEYKAYNSVIYPKQHTASESDPLYTECRASSRNYLCVAGCFDKSVSRQRGTTKLLGKPDGTFLIRERDPDNPREPHHRHTLMLMVNGEISNIKIFSDHDGGLYADNFTDSRKKFRDLKEMVTWHKANKIKHFSLQSGVKEFYLTEQVVD